MATFTVQYTVSGGTPLYNVELSGATIYNNLHTTDGQYEFTGVDEGSYVLSSVDANGCEASTNITLTPATTAPPPLTCQLTNFDITTTQSTGADGTITIDNVVTAQGTLTYSINSGQTFQASNVFTGLAPGIYTVVVNDDIVTGCSLTATTRVFPVPTVQPFSIAFDNEVIIGGGVGNNGSIDDPYFSNCDLEFTVDGNGGGTEPTFSPPKTYRIGVDTSIPSSTLVGVLFDGTCYTDDELLQFTIGSGLGTMSTNVESDDFSGVFKLELFNAEPSIPQRITLNLYLEGSFVDSITYYVEGGGSNPCSGGGAPEGDGGDGEEGPGGGPIQ